MEILETAKKAREDFENKSAYTDELKKLYLNYNKIPEIDKFTQKAKELFPHLNCGLASVHLKNLLPQAQIVNGKFKDHNHTFLLLDNKILDITSDQYGGPKIHFGDIKDPYKLTQL